MRHDPTQKQRGEQKLARIPIKIVPVPSEDRKRLPPWIRIKAPQGDSVAHLKQLLRQKRLVTVCEEASCPNLSECFTKGTATFMIMGDKCTRRCAFCDVAHGRPDPLDPQEPQHLAEAVSQMNLRYVVITSVDRDDLRDGGAGHFSECITTLRTACPHTTIEILVPDFRGRMSVALEKLALAPPDVFNHNIETVPRLYQQARPGSDYSASLSLIQAFKERFEYIPTKSGIMLGLGETPEEVLTVLHDLRAHQCDWLTIGQYLQPSRFHLPVSRYVTPEEFASLGETARQLGFQNVASGPLVRSSYHADKQAKGETVT